MPAHSLRPLTPAEISTIIENRSETIYIPLAPGIQARVEIQLILEPAAPTPQERPVRRCPTARELHHTAEALLQRIYQFHPIED